MRKEFLAIDKDQQGTISLTELKDVMVRTYAVSEKDVKDIFYAMDVNHDDEIHYSEFLAAMLSTRVDPKSAHVGSAFRNFDKDLSGYITVDNLRDVLGNSVDGARVETLLSQADFLQDGRVSFDEFAAFVSGVPFVSYTPREASKSTISVNAISIDAEVLRANAATKQACCTIM